MKSFFFKKCMLTSSKVNVSCFISLDISSCNFLFKTWVIYLFWSNFFLGNFLLVVSFVMSKTFCSNCNKMLKIYHNVTITFTLSPFPMFASMVWNADSWISLCWYVATSCFSNSYAKWQINTSIITCLLNLWLIIKIQ